MKSLWIWKAAVPLALACAGLLIAPGPALLASVLLFEHADDHAHTVSLVTAGGHAHLVISHQGSGERDQALAQHHGEPATSTSEDDHVLHLLEADATSTAPRLAGVSPAPAIATAVAIPPARAARWTPTPPFDARSRSSDSLRTIVLRL